MGCTTMRIGLHKRALSYPEIPFGKQHHISCTTTASVHPASGIRLLLSTESPTFTAGYKKFCNKHSQTII